MTSIDPSSRTQNTSSSTHDPGRPNGGSSDGVLPEPQTAATLDIAALLFAINKLRTKMQEEGMKTDQLAIESRNAEVRKAIKDAYEARKKQIEKESNDGGFFDGMGEAIEAFTTDLVDIDTLTDPFGKLEESCEKANDATFDNKKFWSDLASGALEVGKWAAVAGSVAIAVASCGAGAPIAALAIAGAAASCAGAADSSFHILEKCGVDKDTAMWVDMGLSLGGAAAGGVAGILRIGTTQTAGAVEKAARIGGMVANGVSAASTATGAVAKMEVAAFEREAMLAGADMSEAQKRQARIQQQIQTLLGVLEAALAARSKTAERSGRAIETYNQSRMNMVRA